MASLTKTIKLHLHTDKDTNLLFREVTKRYADACNYISRYIFENNFPLNYANVHKAIYGEDRDIFKTKSQMTISAFKTVTARYKTVKEQLSQKPYKYKDVDGTWKYIPKTLEWLYKPVKFSRPQADFVRNKDYRFAEEMTVLSINTLKKRVRVSFDIPECYREYLEPGSPWKLGTGKLVRMKKKWYFHIPASREIPDLEIETDLEHIVGIDRGLRFLAVSYDENGKTMFEDGNKILEKRSTFKNVRAELQSKGTKSAKRVLKRLSGRENRWMSDVNHRISKALVDKYGGNTLFVLEDLTGVSFSEKNLANRNSSGRNELRSWAFYKLETFLEYKAAGKGSSVIKVSPKYTSQRCPKCGRICKENRKHEKHEYICDACGYRSNDDRIGAMNLLELGVMYVLGNKKPMYQLPKGVDNSS